MRTAIPLILASALCVFLFLHARPPASSEVSGHIQDALLSPTPLELPEEEASSPLLKTTPGVERRYIHDTLGFSFSLPDGYAAVDQKTQEKGEYAVIVASQEGDGFLVIVQPLAADSGTLSPGDIQANSPGETITNIHEVPVNGGVTGFAFHTDASLWKGSGEGLWFTKDGYLYEITTYTKDLPLLSFTRATWAFGSPRR